MNRALYSLGEECLPHCHQLSPGAEKGLVTWGIRRMVMRPSYGHLWSSGIRWRCADFAFIARSAGGLKFDRITLSAFALLQPFRKTSIFPSFKKSAPCFFRSDYPKAGAVHVNCAETLNISGLTAPVPIRDSDSWLFRPNSLIFASTSDRTSGLTIFLGFSRFASLASHATGS